MCLIIQEKDLIPKLFKVLAPRYTEWPISYTKMYRLPTVYPGGDVPLALLELRGNKNNFNSNNNIQFNFWGVRSYHFCVAPSEFLLQLTAFLFQ